MSDSSDPRTVAVEYIEAVGQKDFDRVTELLHPDIEFQMPGKTVRGAVDYVAALRRLGPIILRNNVKETIVDGGEVCVIYDFITDTAIGAVPSAEWVTVEDGRIRTVRLIFHREHWPSVLAELTRRVNSGFVGTNTAQ
jgi:hypothetical protein